MHTKFLFFILSIYLREMVAFFLTEQRQSFRSTSSSINLRGMVTLFDSFNIKEKQILDSYSQPIYSILLSKDDKYIMHNAHI